jgi:nitrile hydratase
MSTHDGDRGRDHDHAHAEGDDHDHGHEVSGSMASQVQSLIVALERRGIVTEAAVDAAVVAFLANAKPSNGAALVARAWVDPAFAALLLDDANAAIDALGLDMRHWARVTLRAVANTPRTHNVIVCTLCSCYPIALLGPSPGWYKSVAYRARVVKEPRAVLGELGLVLRPDVDIRVWDSTAELRYLVVPERPAGTEGMREAELAALVTRDALIGAAACAPPVRA